MLEGGTKDEVRSFDLLFNVLYPKSSAHTLEKRFENVLGNVCSAFQNRRLGGHICNNHHTGIAFATSRRYMPVTYAIIQRELAVIAFQCYAPQTKMLEGLTTDAIQIFDILFNDS
jgi:hypothetical protein